jgi:hypothetical protein
MINNLVLGKGVLPFQITLLTMHNVQIHFELTLKGAEKIFGTKMWELKKNCIIRSSVTYNSPTLLQYKIKEYE